MKYGGCRWEVACSLAHLGVTRIQEDFYECSRHFHRNNVKHFVVLLCWPFKFHCISWKKSNSFPLSQHFLPPCSIQPDGTETWFVPTAAGSNLCQRRRKCTRMQRIRRYKELEENDESITITMLFVEQPCLHREAVNCMQRK